MSSPAGAGIQKKVTRKVVEDIFKSLDGDASTSIFARDVVEALERAGLARLDPRLSDMMDFIEEQGGMAVEMHLREFEKALTLGGNLVVRALTNKLVVPDWPRFVEKLRVIFDEVRHMDGGATASYIPELRDVDPNYYAVSICTVDGQVVSFGDADVAFPVQSCSKPITYCQAVARNGLEYVHKRVGYEPSGRKFNELSLRPVSPHHESLAILDEDEDEGIVNLVEGGAEFASSPSRGAPAQPDPHGPRDADTILAVPYNPMVNAGAQICAALLLGDRQVEAGVKEMLDTYRRLCLGRVTVNASVFLSERGTADRNRCLAYMMKESGALPTGMPIERMLELYFLACSIEINTRQLATLAASLARGGVNPFTHDRVFDSDVVRHCLCLMFSCGLYDASGKWAFSVGVPAKSGVAGAIYGSVSNLMGISVWSPRLDSTGNSTRGVRLFERLGATFAIHILDTLGTDKEDPRKMGTGPVEEETHLMVAAAAQNDVAELQTIIASGGDVNAADYDGRTAIHLAAAEGSFDAVVYLLRHGARPDVEDRWGHTPASEAQRGGYAEIVQVVQCAERGESIDGVVGSAERTLRTPVHTSHSAASLYEREAAAFVKETPKRMASNSSGDHAAHEGRSGLSPATSASSIHAELAGGLSPARVVPARHAR